MDKLSPLEQRNRSKGMDTMMPMIMNKPLEQIPNQNNLDNAETAAKKVRNIAPISDKHVLDLDYTERT